LFRTAATPLPFEFYLTRALEEAYKVGQKPVGADMIDNVLAKDINGLEPRLTREGYNVKVLAELLNVKPRTQLDRLYQKILDDLDELLHAVGLKDA
jgi:hypothetical protein